MIVVNRYVVHGVLPHTDTTANTNYTLLKSRQEANHCYTSGGDYSTSLISALLRADKPGATKLVRTNNENSSGSCRVLQSW